MMGRFYGRRFSSKQDSIDEKKVKELISEDLEKNEKALKELKGLGRPVLKVIGKFLKDEDGFVRKSAVKALIKLSAKEHTKDIKQYAMDVAELLGDKDWFVRSSAVWALGKLKAKEYTWDIVKLLDDKDLLVRSSTVTALGDLDAKEHAKNIMKFLDDENAVVRRLTVEALGKLKVKETLPDIKKQLEKEKDNDVRKAIEEAIRNIEVEKRRR